VRAGSTWQNEYHRPYDQRLFGIFNRATTRVDERLPTVAVEQFHLFLPDLPHERSRAIKIGPFWYKTDICFGSSIDPKLLQFRQCDHALPPTCKCIFGHSDGRRNQKCIDASELPPLQLRGPDWKPLLPPQPTPQPGPHDSSEAARRLIHARAADKRQARSQREAEDRARVQAARAQEDADLDAAVEASLEAALQAQNRAAASDDDSDEDFCEIVGFVRAAPTKRGHEEEEGGETAKRARAEPHDVDLDLQCALLQDAQAANDVDAPPSPTAADPSPDATHPSPMDDDDSDDNSITLGQMREKARPSPPPRAVPAAHYWLKPHEKGTASSSPTRAAPRTSSCTRPISETARSRRATAHAWAQCATCDKWRVLPLGVLADSLPDTWTCGNIGVSCSKVECSLEDADCECHGRIVNSEVVLLSADGTITARYCSPAGAAAAHDLTPKDAIIRCTSTAVTCLPPILQYATSSAEASAQLAALQQTSARAPSKPKAPTHKPTLSSMSTGVWSPTEDEALRRLVKERGAKDWPTIAAALPGRSSKQCRERWLNKLDPANKKTPFDQDEDRVLVRERHRRGNKWAEIALLLPGRTGNAVKNRWNGTLKGRFEGFVQTLDRATRDAYSALEENVAPATAFTLDGELLERALAACRTRKEYVRTI